MYFQRKGLDREYFRHLISCISLLLYLTVFYKKLLLFREKQFIINTYDIDVRYGVP